MPQNNQMDEQFTNDIKKAFEAKPEDTKPVVHAFEKAPIKKRNGTDVYEGFQNSKQSFYGIGCLEAIGGLVILRGRNGRRDTLFTLERAIDRHEATGQHVSKMATLGIRGWDELMELQTDLRHRILEAIEQSRTINAELSKQALDFEAFWKNKSIYNTSTFREASKGKK